MIPKSKRETGIEGPGNLSYRPYYFFPLVLGAQLSLSKTRYILLLLVTQGPDVGLARIRTCLLYDVQEPFERKPQQPKKTLFYVVATPTVD